MTLEIVGEVEAEVIRQLCPDELANVVVRPDPWRVIGSVESAVFTLFSLLTLPSEDTRLERLLACKLARVVDEQLTPQLRNEFDSVADAMHDLSELMSTTLGVGIDIQTDGRVVATVEAESGED